MIEPNMATMLSYLLTDIAIPRQRLRELLSAAVSRSYNAISIDSDQSTSDMVVILSSGKIPCVDEGSFIDGLEQICADLAEDLVRNGEGVQHVLAVTVSGAPDHEAARGIGKAVVNSPLVQTAINGNDANIGRLVMAMRQCTIVG